MYSAEGNGVQIMGIDILPAEFPVESSQLFSEKLYPYIKEMVSSILILLILIQSLIIIT